MTEGTESAASKWIRLLGLIQIPLVIVAALMLFYLGRRTIPLIQQQKDLAATIENEKTEIGEKKKELEDLNKNIDKLTSTVAKLQHLINESGGPELKAAAQQIPWWDQLSVKATAKPTGRKTDHLDMYAISLWVTGPQSILSRIQKVDYFFNDPTFNPKTKTGENLADGFRIDYNGWGCLHSLRVTIIPRDNLPNSTTDFDMCAGLGW